LLAGGVNGIAKLWDIQSGQEQRELKGRASKVTFVTYSPDGKSIGTVSADYVARMWDAATGRFRFSQQLNAACPCSNSIMAISPDSRAILVPGDGKTPVRFLDAETGHQLQQFKGPTGVLNTMALVSDGNALLTTSGGDPAAKIWDITTGRQLRQLKMDGLFSAAASPDGKTILTIAGAGSQTANNAIILWDAATGRQLRRIACCAGDVLTNSVFSPDGRFILTGGLSAAHLLDTATGRELHKLSADMGSGLAFSPDSKTALTGGIDVKLWDAATGNVIRQLHGHVEEVYSSAFSPDGKVVVTGSDDGTTRLWDANSGTALASMIYFSDGEWLTITPEGFFDASSPKAADNLNVVRGLEVYSIDQFRDALFRPDLVKAKLAGDPDGTVKAAAAKLDLDKVVASGNAPKVAITSPADGSVASTGEVSVEGAVTEQGGGIGRIEWRLNGRLVGIDTRGLERIQDNAAANTAIKISQKMVLDAGDNVVEVLAYNTRGLVASQSSRITIKAIGPAIAAKPRLFVLAVGVNDYYDGRLRLNFAAPDARSMAASFEKAGAGLYESVKAVTVLDADVTRANLDNVFTQLGSEVKASDVFVFFVAGHGRTLDGHYYFLPQDFKYRDQGSYAESGLSQEQWQKWITLVKARKSVLIYDTCESGAVTADNVVVASRGLQRVEEQAVAYEKLRNATGRTILAASTDSQPALEGYHGHGVFSYVVMEALQKAQTNANGLIEITGLISYIDDRVPDITSQVFHQSQFPQNKMLGSNFAIAKPIAMALTGTEPPGEAAQLTDPATPTKPTHVVITPADVFTVAGGQNFPVERLPAGTLLSLVKTEQGWMLMAKEGKMVGYVASDHLLRVQ
jgi:WD40 repeat protein